MVAVSASGAGVSKAGSEDRDKREVGAARTGACKDRLESTSVSLYPQVSNFDDGVESAGEIGSILIALKYIQSWGQ